MLGVEYNFFITKKNTKTKIGKVKFKKIVYRKKKIRLFWKRVKKANGYHVAFFKRKNGKTRMVKFTKKNTLTLSWNGIGKCYVKIRAYRIQKGKKTYGPWGPCKRVKKG